MCVIGTYFYIFHEGTNSEFQWEIRHQEFDKLERRQVSFIKWYIRRVSARAHYVIITLVCAFLATYKIIFSQNIWYQIIISLTFTWVLTIFVITFMVIKVTDWPALRDELITKWQKVKAAEEQEAQKRKNNRNPQ